MLGHDLFVGRHHVLATFNRLEDQRARRLLAADDFDHSVDGRIIDDFARIGDQRNGQVERSRFAGIAHEHLADLHWPAYTPFQRSALVQQHPGDAAANGPQSE